MNFFWKDTNLALLMLGICVVLVTYGFNKPTEPNVAVKGDCPTVVTVEATTEEPVLETTATPETTDEPAYINLGEFTFTAYCGENYPHICNDGDSTYTATGTTPKAGRTIAVDPKVIPYGTNVIIDGHVYVAEDCGGAIKGNRIDVYFESHEEALQFGVQHKEVFIEGEKQ